VLPCRRVGAAVQARYIDAVQARWNHAGALVSPCTRLVDATVQVHWCYHAGALMPCRLVGAHRASVLMLCRRVATVQVRAGALVLPCRRVDATVQARTVDAAVQARWCRHAGTLMPPCRRIDVDAVQACCHRAGSLVPPWVQTR